MLLGIGLPWMAAWWAFLDYSGVEVESGSPCGGTEGGAGTLAVEISARVR